MEKDLVAQLPDEIALYERENGFLPKDLKLEAGFICQWGERFYIHTRATLPLKSLKDGVGFGLWVEVEKEVFENYLKVQDNDELYKKFSARGKLANEWAGFENIRGVEVTFRTISVDEKVYITEVHMDKPRDPLFEIALNTPANDHKTIERIRNLVKAYLAEYSS